MISINRFNMEVKIIVGQIKTFYKPEKIILFGSLAEGRINDGTDIDLFIIKDDVPEIGVDRIRQLEDIVKYRIATDFIIYKPDEVKKRLELGDPFVKGILENGIVLYDAK